jgi:hypothetical protein
MKRMLVFGLALMLIASLAFAKKDVRARQNENLVVSSVVAPDLELERYVNCTLFNYDTSQTTHWYIGAYFYPGDAMKNYYDPADCESYVPPSPYPFLIDSVEIPLYFHPDYQSQGLYTFIVDIEYPDMTNPDCPYPGTEVCVDTFEINYNGIDTTRITSVIPMDCCVDRPFFVSLHYLDSPTGSYPPSMMFDRYAQLDTCIQYYNYPTPWVEWHDNILNWYYGLTNWINVVYGDCNEPCNPIPGPCIPNDPGDRCEAPIVLPNTLTWSNTFDLCDYCNDYDLEPCTGWPSQSEDMVFEFTWTSPPPDDNNLYVLVLPSTMWDISVAVISECGEFGPTSCIEGADDNGPGWPEAINLMNMPDGTYYVVVSGFMANCGNYAICISSNYPLPVELVSFTGTAGDERATLKWTTGSETDNDHFYLVRSTDGRNYSRISGDIAASNSPTGSSYTYVDRNLVNGTEYSYKLIDVDINGTENMNNIVVSVTPNASEPVTPDDYALHQNYPNPFNPNTTISYDVKETGLVTLTVFDILGREVMTLVNDNQEAGRYSVEFDATDLATGIYFYQMKVNDFSDLKKMVVLK